MLLTNDTGLHMAEWATAPCEQRRIDKEECVQEYTLLEQLAKQLLAQPARQSIAS